MKTLALIALVLLLVWWCVLTVWTISSHRERVRLAANWTPENEVEYQKLEASIPRYRMRPKNYVVTAPFMVPFVLLLLPFYVHSWFVRDPFDKHEHSA